MIDIREKFNLKEILLCFGATTHDGHVLREPRGNPVDLQWTRDVRLLREINAGAVLDCKKATRAGGDDGW